VSANATTEIRYAKCFHTLARKLRTVSRLVQLAVFSQDSYICKCDSYFSSSGSGLSICILWHDVFSSNKNKAVSLSTRISLAALLRKFLQLTLRWSSSQIAWIYLIESFVSYYSSAAMRVCNILILRTYVEECCSSVFVNIRACRSLGKWYLECRYPCCLNVSGSCQSFFSFTRTIFLCSSTGTFSNTTATNTLLYMSWCGPTCRNSRPVFSARAIRMCGLKSFYRPGGFFIKFSFTIFKSPPC